MNVFVSYKHLLLLKHTQCRLMFVRFDEILGNAMHWKYLIEDSNSTAKDSNLLERGTRSRSLIIGRSRLSRTDVKVAAIFLGNIARQAMMYHARPVRCQIVRFIGISATLVWPVRTGRSRAFLRYRGCYRPFIESNRISRVSERVSEPGNPACTTIALVRSHVSFI